MLGRMPMWRLCFGALLFRTAYFSAYWILCCMETPHHHHHHPCLNSSSRKSVTLPQYQWKAWTFRKCPQGSKSKAETHETRWDDLFMGPYSAIAPCKGSDFLEHSFCKPESRLVLSTFFPPHAMHHEDHLVEIGIPAGMLFSQPKATQLIFMSTFIRRPWKNYSQRFSHASQCQSMPIAFTMRKKEYK